MRELPLVSCIMPTYNRRAFAPLALEYFRRQTYPNRELIVVDDGSDPVGDLVDSWATDAGAANGSRGVSVRYVRLHRRHTVGAKRNIACEAARGDVVLHWDDDDWHAPRRIAFQVDALAASGLEICGLQRLLFYDVDRGRAHAYQNDAPVRSSRPFWLSGSTLCYTKELWRSNPFPDQDVGEDVRFASRVRERALVLDDNTFHVGIIHGQNVSPKRTTGSYWEEIDVGPIRRLLGDDWKTYRDWKPNCRRRGENDVALSAPETSVPLRAGADPCVATIERLETRELQAFNYMQKLPRMRRWELPWALFAAELSDTMSVLDCTINPVNFEERIGRLFPHVLYRYWNPVADKRFRTPRGFPDGSFDRVFCINTLEHLLAPQRAQLICALSDKLKIGGRLILTSDYYFDSLWERDNLLRSGVIRSDRREVFNGWNKVTVDEWTALCEGVGLRPISVPVGEPLEGDRSLYLNVEAAPHAVMGGVFEKVGATHSAARPHKHKICLGLLTWNTREISLESARSLVEEARMLERLGLRAFVCICDNGSDDGTAEALQKFSSEIDVEHKLILNKVNRGNSIARNQMIDCALEAGADYVLFLDGDVEIVPFSSYSMFRAMETFGRELGCLGADSAGQTPRRERATPYLYGVDGRKVEENDDVAWTQYGMFRKEVFEAGVRFDERDPFDGPGWGFEDNDLAFQISTAGFIIARFFGMTYLHRAIHSSLGILSRQGVDAQSLFERRRAYLIEKWSGVESIERGPLEAVRKVRMPLVRV